MGEIVDRCAGADFDSGGMYRGPDGILIGPVVGLFAVTLTSDTPEGSTAVLRVSDDSFGIRRFVTAVVEADRKIRFVFDAKPDTLYHWRLTVIGPGGSIGEGSTANEFVVGNEDQPCDVGMLRETIEFIDTE